jgi:very-short-patch-repair endonuclease
MAAVLTGGGRAVLSYRSAGQLWGLLPRSGSAPEVTVPSAWRSRAGIVVHRSVLPGDERAAVDGIPVTSVPRTLLDLAVVLTRPRLERALNEAEVRELTDVLSLPDLIARYPRRRGVANLRALLDAHNPGGITRSRLEERFLSFLDAHDLPRPRLNADLALRGRFYEVDCLWQSHRLVVELDSRTFHDTDRAFEKDRERDRILLAEGWRVTRVTWRQLEDEPNAITADLRELLRFRAGRPTLS